MATENPNHFCVYFAPPDLSEAAKEKLRGQKGGLLTETRWPVGSVITIKFLEGDSSLQQRVREKAEFWLFEDGDPTKKRLADLDFQFVSEGDADVRIAFKQGDGSWSYLGTFCKQIPQSDPTMNFGWLTSDSDDDEVQRVVVHEFGHALGMIHEHQNPENPIEWNEAAVIADMAAEGWSEEQTRQNILEVYPREALVATPVDRKSIMLYPIPASWTLDGFSSGLNKQLSSADKDFIREVYS